MKYNKEARDLIRDLFRYLVGISIIAGVFIVLYKMVPLEGYKEAVIALVGALAGALGTIVTYEFGSSRSSQIKDERQEANPV